MASPQPMPDAHTPPLTSLQLTDEEKSAVAIALESNNPWRHEDAQPPQIRPLLKSVKDKLSELHMARQGGTCCYCRTLLEGWGPYVRDREHVLPKDDFKSLSYETFNISISCKRCNMEIKGKELDFIVEPVSILDDPENPERYKLIHPNFEIWEDHLSYHHVQMNTKRVISYSYLEGDEKGKYTYEYFDLKSLTASRFQENQGGHDAQSFFKKIVAELAAQFDQV